MIDVDNKTVTITGTDVNHIKNVLRMKTGEEFSVSTGEDSKEYRCAIREFLKDSVDCELRFIKEDNVELPSKIYLFQGLAKGDKMETVIQKAVELGVYEIIPVTMDRCVMKLDEKKISSRIARWQAIAEAAAKQSKRAIIPRVCEPMSFKNAVEIKQGESVGIIIGPEGGISEGEIELAGKKGFEAVTLGKRILRTETAGMTVLSILMYHLERD